MNTLLKSVAYDHAAHSTQLRRLGLLTILRIIVAGVLTVSLSITTNAINRDANSLPPAILAMAYCLAALAALWALKFSHIAWRGQLFGQLLLDILILGLLVHSLGGSAGGYVILLMLPIAAASALLSWSFALFVCSVCVLAVMADGLWRMLVMSQSVDWLLLGLQCAGGFALMAMLRYTSARAEHTDRLERKARAQTMLAEALQDQHIQEESLGVLVIDANSAVQLINAPARSFALQAGVLLEPGERLDRHLRLQTWLDACRHAQEFAATWPPTQSLQNEDIRDGGTTLSMQQPDSTDMLLIKASRLPSMPGLTVLTIDTQSNRKAQAQQDNLAAIGRLSASIAHEIRNPLAAISQAAELMRESDGLHASDLKMLDMVLSNTQRIERIVQNLLGWSRGMQAQAQTLDPVRHIQTMLHEVVLNLQLEPSVVQVLKSQDKLDAVRFDADHLHQILSNLLGNAARFATGKPNSIAVHLRKRTKGLAIVVLDDGVRVDAQVKAHLFEPFQSASKQGTGLGLFLCREYARANRGGLRLVEPAQGAADNDPSFVWVPKPYTKAFVLAVPWAKQELATQV